MAVRGSADLSVLLRSVSLPVFLPARFGHASCWPGSDHLKVDSHQQEEGENYNCLRDKQREYALKVASLSQ